MELGKRLKEAREEKNLTLQDIQDMTKIQRRYLEAIEKGNYRAIPGNFYVRAFVREYALAVGLNPDQLLEEYKSELPSTMEEEEQAQLSRVNKHRRTSQTSGRPTALLSFLPRLMVILLIIAIVVTVWFFYQSKTEPDTTGQTEDDSNQVEINRQDDPEQNVPDEEGDQEEQSNSEDDGETEQEEDEQEDSPETPQPELALIEKNESANIPTATYEVKNTNELKLNFNITGECWLGIENDQGKSFISQNIKSGDSPLDFDLTGEKEIRLNIGYAPALSFTVNDVPFEYPVDPEQAGHEHQIITIVVNETAE